jgi:phosphoglycolate phosphatase
VDPVHTLMVGDDLRDIQAGQAAGAQTALAAYGYLDPGLDVAGLGNCTRIEHPRAILGLVDLAAVR